MTPGSLHPQYKLIVKIAQVLERKVGRLSPLHPRDYATVEHVPVEDIHPFGAIRQQLVRLGYGPRRHFMTIEDVLGFFGYADSELWVIAIDLAESTTWHGFAKRFRKLIRLRPGCGPIVGC